MKIHALAVGLVLFSIVSSTTAQNKICYWDLMTSFYGNPGFGNGDLDKADRIPTMVTATKDCNVVLLSGLSEGGKAAGECGPACSAYFNALNSGEHGSWTKHVSKSVGNSGAGGTRLTASIEQGFADPSGLSNVVSRTYFHEQYMACIKDGVFAVSGESTAGSDKLMADPFVLKGTWTPALTGGDRADATTEPAASFYQSLKNTFGFSRSTEAGQAMTMIIFRNDLHNKSDREFAAIAPVWESNKSALTIMAMTNSNQDKNDNRAQLGASPIGALADTHFKPALDRSPPIATGVNGQPTEHFVVNDPIDIEVTAKDVGMTTVPGLTASRREVVVETAYDAFVRDMAIREGDTPLGPRPEPPPDLLALHHVLFMILPAPAPPVEGSILLALLAGAGVLGIMGAAAYYNRGALAAAFGGKSEKSGWAESSAGSMSKDDTRSGASRWTRGGGGADAMSGKSGATRGRGSDGMSGASRRSRDKTDKHMSGITKYTRGNSNSSKSSRGSSGKRKHSAGRKNSGGNRMTGVTDYTRMGSVGSKGSGSHASRGTRSSSGNSRGGRSHASKASRSSSTGSHGGHSHATRGTRSSSGNSRGGNSHASRGTRSSSGHSKGGNSHASKASRSSSGSRSRY